MGFVAEGVSVEGDAKVGINLASEGDVTNVATCSPFGSILGMINEGIVKPMSS